MGENADQEFLASVFILHLATSEILGEEQKFNSQKVVTVIIIFRKNALEII